MLVFVGVGLLVQPLDPAGDVGGLVDGVVEHRVGGDDPHGRQQHQRQRDRQRVPPQEACQAGFRWFCRGCPAARPWLIPAL
jgi:hypothetical protein